MILRFKSSARSRRSRVIVRASIQNLRSAKALLTCLYRTMFFQQWTGVNAILYYAPTIFQDLGLTGSTNSLLATGVVGVVLVSTDFYCHCFVPLQRNTFQNVPRDYTSRHLG